MKEKNGARMKIRYFSDTDTVLMEFSDAEVVETREINENVYIEFDKDGNLVSMTIEHARKQANISELSYYQMEKGIARHDEVAE
jgi:uncharacterized protein YuzE